MNSFLVILIGSILGMLLTVVVASAQVQIGSKYAIGFYQAFKVYTVKHVGPLIAGFIVVLIAMFILPDIIANTVDGKYSDVLKRVVGFLRSYSVLLGVLAQTLGFVIVRNSHKYLKEEESKATS